MLTLDDFFQYVYGEALQEPRFLALPEAERNERIEAEKEHCRVWFDKVNKAIDEKDVDVLVKTLYTTNPFACRVFAERTGLNIGKTNKSINEAIFAYCGNENVAAYHEARRAKAEQREAEQQAKAAERVAKERDDELNSRIVRDPFPCGVVGLVTWKEAIDTMFAKGYRPVEAKRGFARMIRMTLGGRYFNITGKHQMAYVDEIATVTV